MTEKNLDKFTVTFDSSDPKILKRAVINIPLEKLSENKEDGMAILIGKLEEAKTILIRKMSEKIVSKTIRLTRPNPNGPIRPNIA